MSYSRLAWEVDDLSVTCVLSFISGNFKNFDKLPLRSAREVDDFFNGREADWDQGCDNLTPRTSVLLDTVLGVEYDVIDKLEKLDKHEDTGIEVKTMEEESGDTSDKDFEWGLESEEMESGET